MQQLTEERTHETSAEQVLPSVSLSREMLLDFTTFSQWLKDAKNAVNDKAITSPEVSPVLPHHRWQMIEHVCDGKTGWEGALFHTRVNGTDHYAIYHQGANDKEDIHSVRDIFRGEVPAQLEAAQFYTQRWNGLIAQMQQGKPAMVADVGYSLGGVVCSLTSKGERPCVVFDCPSPAAVYDKLNVPDEVRNRNKITVLSPHATYYNSNGRHYGDVLVAGEKFWHYPLGKRVGMRHFSEMSKQSHKINRIGQDLAKQPQWNFQPAQEMFAGQNAERPVSIFQAVQEFVQESRLFRSRQTFTERLFARLVERQAKKGPEAEQKFVAKIAKWTERSSFLERKVTETVLGKKVADTPAQSWVSRSVTEVSYQSGRSL